MGGELEGPNGFGSGGIVNFLADILMATKRAHNPSTPPLITWLELHNYPFEFSTEASINLSDDAELLKLMRQANFFALLVGIRRPAPETLVWARKKQDTRRAVTSDIPKLCVAGRFGTP